MKSKLTIGIDVGGTNIKGALVDERGRTYSFRQIPTPHDGPDFLLESISQLAQYFQKEAVNKEISGMGLALPGTVNNEKGTLTYSPNLNFNHVDFRVGLKATKLAVKIINDANAAALGEYYYGNGQGSRNMICITLGTGVGSGFIVDGVLLNGLAGEAGHMVISPSGPLCPCGRRGCWEALVSATAMVNRAQEKIKEGKRFLGIIARDQYLTSKTIFNAYLKEDRLAQEVVSETREYLALGLVNLVNIFNPERIVISGGVAGSSGILLDGIKEIVAREAFPGLGMDLEIKAGALGSQAGVIGAAAFYLNRD